MTNHIKAVIVDDDTILIDGKKLAGQDEVSDVLGSALRNDPDLILVIEPKAGCYKGIGKVIYGSQRVGMPVENLRYTMEDGEVVTFDALRARTPPPSE